MQEDDRKEVPLGEQESSEVAAEAAEAAVERSLTEGDPSADETPEAKTPIEPEESAEAEESAEPEATAENGEEPEKDEAEEDEPAGPRLFTLRFKIPLAEFTEFHRIMSRDAVEKNRKKTTIIGGVEMALGVVLFVLTLLGVLPGGALQLLLMVLLIGFGFYSAFYYKLFYEKALVKAVNKQYQKSPFPTVEITLDFYEDRCVERSDGGRMVTKFKNIVGVRTTPSLIMIMVSRSAAC